MDLALQIAGLLIGLLYLWWEYHADSKLWIASIVMPSISLWLYFRKGLYADFAINIYYFVIAIYGFIAWTWKSKRHTTLNDKTSEPVDAEKAQQPGKVLRIRHASLPVAILCAAMTGILWWIIWYVLTAYTNSTVPVADAFTTALSIVAMWMLARKYIEQWLAWFVVDAVCVGLYIYKNIPLYAFLYALYTFIALLGYRKWLYLMRRGE